jgi:hypothetical protein
MKKNYFLFLFILAFLSTNKSIAAECPITAFTTGTAVFTVYPVGTSACVDRPSIISIGSSIFTMVICDDGYSQYQLTSGTPVTSTDPFTIDSGFDVPCTYVAGLLGAEEIGIINKASFKIFPNPISTSENDNLSIRFAINTTADISVYDISGKVILKDAMTNSNSKEVNISNLEYGIYILKISTDTFSLTRKVVVMK